ncbi:ATP phosphoribosyltransferase regulatory subunit [Rickettsiales bacterium]|nr:ATP phosphoribosyltransferase regulatory subunit [Rickettsiales bacterium]
MDNNKLLPEGFCDLIGDEARINNDTSYKLISFFQGFGYDLVKTPLVELENTLKDYQKTTQKSFQIFDINSGQNLMFRSDITAQISRLVETRLKDHQFPLRLCYLGDVLKISSRAIQSDRQITQAGIELIGSDNILKSASEIIELTINSLNKIDVENLTIDFSIPNFLKLLLEELNLGDDRVRKAIEEKNISNIKDLTSHYADSLVNIALEIKNPQEIRKNLVNLKISSNLLDKFDNLLLIIDKINYKHSAIEILVNIFDDLEFSYHDNIGFSIFTKESLLPIARGGLYEIKKGVMAAGSSIYINLIKDILLKSDQCNVKKILISDDISQKQLDLLKKDGYITIKSLCDNSIESLQEEAKLLNINFIYFNSAIKNI